MTFGLDVTLSGPIQIVESNFSQFRCPCFDLTFAPRIVLQEVTI